MSAVSNFQLATYAEQMREQRELARCELSEARDMLAKANELITALEARNEDLERNDARQRVRIAALEAELRDAKMVANCMPFAGKTVDGWLP